jgi:HIV Tat-specific factor 1
MSNHTSNLPPTLAQGASVAEHTAAFTADPRVYFSKETNTWRYEQDDGSELEYDTSTGQWIPLIDDDLISKQQAAYSVAGVDENVPAAPILARENKKRKQPDYTSATQEPPPGPSTKRGKGKDKGTEKKSKNTAVYVTGLPPDTETEELVERFSRCGVIEEDDEGEPKIKMYAREDGTFSGESLVIYFKEDSVLLALSILDGAELRIGDASTVMSVQKAEFSHKNTGSGASTQERRTVDKKKATRRIGKMQKKLEEWDDEDGFGPSIQPQQQINEPAKSNRIVVLKYMFTLKELEEDAALLLELKEDVREECSSLGQVTNVVLYDLEEDGIMTVKFRDPVSATACVIKMNGRFFAGRRVEAMLYSGKQRFKRSGGGMDMDFEEGGIEAEKKRLEAFSNWLLTDGD